jgi:hypothetical protein
MNYFQIRGYKLDLWYIKIIFLPDHGLEFLSLSGIDGRKNLDGAPRCNQGLPGAAVEALAVLRDQLVLVLAVVDEITAQNQYA